MRSDRPANTVKRTYDNRCPSQNDGPNCFSHVVDSVPRLFRPFHVDAAKRVATGVLTDAEGNGHRACLAYDDASGELIATVVVKVSRPLSPDGRKVLGTVQNATKLVRAGYDEDHRSVVFDAGSVVPTLREIPMAIRGILKRLGRTLADDRVRTIVHNTDPVSRREVTA